MKPSQISSHADTQQMCDILGLSLPSYSTGQKTCVYVSPITGCHWDMATSV